MTHNIIKSPDILNTILTYVPTRNLLPFFIINKINLNTKFRYDLSQYILNTEQVITLFNTFPNITVMRLQIVGDSACHYLPKSWLKKLTHLHITTNDYYNSPHFNVNLLILKKCPSLTSFTMTGITGKNIDSILFCPKIQSIKFNDYTKINTNYLPSLPQLHKIIFAQSKINTNNITNLLSCSHLHTLEISTIYLNEINIPTLTHLTIRDKYSTNTKTHITLSTLNSCPLLHTLKLIRVAPTIIITPTKYNLHKLIIFLCDIQNINQLSTSKLRLFDMRHTAYTGELNCSSSCKVKLYDNNK